MPPATRGGKKKLSNPAAIGQPEDQLRAPFEHLARLPESAVAAVGESSIGDLKTRPGYAITVHNALVGFVELKAPGKGADPRKFKDPHDKAQWEKLSSLPTLIYTDGNAFSLWQNGELVDSMVSLIGDIVLGGTRARRTTRIPTGSCPRAARAATASRQPHLDRVHVLAGPNAIFREQTQRHIALLLFIEDFQAFAPGRLLAIIDLAQI